MRIVVTSDVHKRRSILYDILERHQDNADWFVNLGDSESDLEDVPFLYPKVKMKCVAGNCDFGSTLPLWESFTFAGKKVFFTHGHPFYVKHGYEVLESKAKAEGADICLFGHTHTPYTETKDGIFYMNPGAVCDGYYGVIDVEKGQIFGYINRI